MCVQSGRYNNPSLHHIPERSPWERWRDNEESDESQREPHQRRDQRRNESEKWDATHQTHVDLACVKGDEDRALAGGIDSTVGAMLIKT